MTDQRPDPDVESIGALISDVSRDVSALLRQELELARVELRREAVRAGRATGMLVACAVAGQLALLFGSAAFCWWLSRRLEPGYALLLVALLWAIAATALYLNGSRMVSTLRVGRLDRTRHRMARRSSTAQEGQKP
jgi:hypothetical protein